MNDITRAWDNKGDIVVGNDVWIGYEAVVLAGVPAKPIRKRFSQEEIDSLLRTKWWDWSRERIAQHLEEIQAGKIDK